MGLFGRFFCFSYDRDFECYDGKILLRRFLQSKESTICSLIDAAFSPAFQFTYSMKRKLTIFQYYSVCWLFLGLRLSFDRVPSGSCLPAVLLPLIGSAAPPIEAEDAGLELSPRFPYFNGKGEIAYLIEKTFFGRVSQAFWRTKSRSGKRLYLSEVFGAFRSTCFSSTGITPYALLLPYLRAWCSFSGWSFGSLD